MRKMKKKIAYIIIGMALSNILNGCAMLDDFPLLNGNKDVSADAETVEVAPEVIVVNNGGKNYQMSGELEEQSEGDIDEAPLPEYEEIYDDVNKIYSKECQNPEEVVLTFAGDTCFYDDFSLMSSYRNRGSDINNCIDASLLEEMRSADIFMINNEFCYSNRGTPIEGKKYAFRSKPENVTILHDMGADIVSLANNHAYDWGPDALSDTVDVLNEARVPFVGAGKNINEAMKPAYFRANGITISYVSATQIERLGNPDTKEATEDRAGVLRTLEPTKACKVIEEARANSDFVVMYVHWGSENTDLVEQSQRDLAKKYVEAGADLIIGDHSHCLQGIDYIDDVPIFYSLGNYWFNSKTVDTGLAKITLKTSDVGHENPGDYIKCVQFVPAIQTGCSTKEVSESEKTRILNYLQGISNHAQIEDTTGFITKSDTDHNVQHGANTSPTRVKETVDEQPALEGASVIEDINVYEE